MADPDLPSGLSPVAVAPLVRETHSGLVIMVGARAYKVKKAVDLGFLDFRTLSARLAACERELALNRRLAPDVYQEVARLTGADGTPGEPILVMRRMPDERRLTSLLTSGAEPPAGPRGGGSDNPSAGAAGEDLVGYLDALAVLLADFHDHCDRGPQIDDEGGPVGLARRWRDNLAQSRRFRGNLLASEVVDGIAELVERYLTGREELLRERVAAGRIIDGHGDLQADDIFCLADGPRVLDCIEFDDRLRWVDRIDDAAFLAMDLERLGRPELATHFLDRYAELSGDRPPSSLTHHYIAYRAFVRSKVACMRAEQGLAAARRTSASLAELTLRHLQAADVRLLLVGGAPGCGKSTLAAQLAPHVDAIVLSTDAIRADLAFDPETRYSPAATDRVYAEILRRAAQQLRLGRTVIADANWPIERWREDARRVARDTASTLIELECHAPVDLAAARAERRLRAGTSPSEAGEAIARRLAATRDPWPQAHRIDNSGTVEAAVRQAVAVLREQSPARARQPSGQSN